MRPLPLYLPATVLLALAGSFLAAQGTVSTRSFTTGPTGSDPFTVINSGSTITVNLAAIAGAEVYRATLDPYVQPSQSQARYDIQDAAGRTLSLLPPRYLVFDATAAVRAAIGTGTMTLTIVAPGQGFGNTLSLDVLCNRGAPQAIAQATNTVARFRDGDTMIRFAEVNPPHLGNTWTVGGYNAALASLGHDRSPKTRYRIYRSNTPFTNADALKTATLVDEIMPMTGWNGGQYGFDPTSGGNDSFPIATLPIDNLTLSVPGTGIYVNRFKGTGAPTAYYCVSHTRNGAEDFSNLVQGSNTTGATTEFAGRGMTVLWKQNTVRGLWFFKQVDMTLNYFVRWAATPNWNVPSRAFNYRLGVPHDTAVPRPPLEITPHAWGEHFDTFQRWIHYDAGALLLTTNLHYYNSYTGFHECAGTLRSYDDGTVQPFYQARLLDFVFDFVQPSFNIDRNRIFMVGGSMGGAAGHFWGMRSGHLFASVDAAVGNNIPAENLTSEFEWCGEWGPIAWQSRYSNSQLVRFGYPEITRQDNQVVWDYFDNTKWFAANRGAETPYLTFANAPNDPAIGWPQAWKTAQAMRDTKRSLNFTWGQNGHAQYTEPLPIDFVLNRSLPAFTNCSLDDDLGTNAFNGSPAGRRNFFLRWDVNTIVDRADRWEMDIFLDPSAPNGSTTADVTPRRLQSLAHGAGQSYQWFLVEGSTTKALGGARADAWGVFTLPGLAFSKTVRRVIVQTVPAVSLTASRHSVSMTSGGTIELAVDAGPSRAGRLFVLLGGFSGTSPGTPLPGGATLPLNWDIYTAFVASYLNTPLFANFVSILNSSGRTTATLNMIPLPSGLGLTFFHAGTMFAPWDWTTNPVGIEIIR